MKIRTLIYTAGAALTLGAVTSAIAQPPAAPASPPAMLQAGDPDAAFAVSGKFSEPTGEKIFQRVCAACHMSDAKGATGAGTYPSLAANKKLAIGVYPLNVIQHGLNGMPALGTMMTDQQVADVVNYVRTNFGNKYKDVVTAAQAKAMR